MLRLQSRAITFNLPIIPTLPAKQWIKICHLNIRGYLNHVSDVKQDNSICACDIIYALQKLISGKQTLYIQAANQTKITSSTEKTELQVLTREA